MRHRKSFNHLGRKTAHRSAMLANLASSLIIHKRIETTTAKAKALRSFVEPLITRSKEDTTHSRRTVFSYLQNKQAVGELFREVGVKVAERPGGYLRLLKIGSRAGDNADMCIVELVDFNENLLADTSSAKTKTGRRRRGSKKKPGEERIVEPQAGTVVEAEKEEVPATEDNQDELSQIASPPSTDSSGNNDVSIQEEGVENIMVEEDNSEDKSAVVKNEQEGEIAEEVIAEKKSDELESKTEEESEPQSPDEVSEEEKEENKG